MIDPDCPCQFADGDAPECKRCSPRVIKTPEPEKSPEPADETFVPDVGDLGENSRVLERSGFPGLFKNGYPSA